MKSFWNMDLEELGCISREDLPSVISLDVLKQIKELEQKLSTTKAELEEVNKRIELAIKYDGIPITDLPKTANERLNYLHGGLLSQQAELKERDSQLEQLQAQVEHEAATNSQYQSLNEDLNTQFGLVINNIKPFVHRADWHKLNPSQLDSVMVLKDIGVVNIENGFVTVKETPSQSLASIQAQAIRGAVDYVSANSNLENFSNHWRSGFNMFKNKISVYAISLTTKEAEL